MDKDFWERINALEELANKVKIKDWEHTESFGKHVLIAFNGVYGVQIAEAVFVGGADEIEHAASANPTMIQEMIAEIWRLEKEATWLAQKLGDAVPLSSLWWREAARKAAAELGDKNDEN